MVGRGGVEFSGMLDKVFGLEVLFIGVGLVLLRGERWWVILFVICVIIWFNIFGEKEMGCGLIKVVFDRVVYWLVFILEDKFWVVEIGCIVVCLDFFLGSLFLVVIVFVLVEGL